MHTTKKHLNDIQGPDYQERFLPLIFRHATLALYRRSGRFAFYRDRIGFGQIPPMPSLADALSVYFSQVLPPGIVSRLSVRGLLILAHGVNIVFVIAAWCARLMFKLARPFWRLLRRLRRPFTVPRYVKVREKSFIMWQAPVSNLNVCFGDKALLKGFTFENNVLKCFFKRIGFVQNPCQVVLHLYPENVDVLTADRVDYGFFCKDHNPAVDITRWPRFYVYRDETILSDLPAGYYRVEAGIIDVVTLERFPVEGTYQRTVDLGWLMVGNLVQNNHT